MMYIDMSILIPILHGFGGGHLAQIGAFFFERLVVMMFMMLDMLWHFGLG